jgi:hypothetical protein
MEVFFPVFSCILVGSVLICCYVRHHRRRRRELQRLDSLYVVIPSAPPAVVSYQAPQPSAPPMPTIYEEDPKV